MNSAEFLLDTLEANGVRYIFGNPGTTEIALVRACEQRGNIRYVVALSELAAVPMADGHARAARALGVVNLHVAPGLGNGMGALYTAGVAGTPLLVLIGGQDRRFLHTQPILWGPLERMAQPVCKAVFGLAGRHDTASNIRRALRTALTPPFGPVALVCPPDLLEQALDAAPAAVSPPRLAGLDDEALEAHVRFLSSASAPAIIAAEDVHWSDAAAALEALAAVLDAPVYAAPYTGMLPIDARARTWAGYLPPSREQIARRLAAHDALLFAGGRGLRTTLYSEAALPQRTAWIGHDATVQGLDREFEIAHVADLRRALRALADHLPSGTGARTGAIRRPTVELPVRGTALHPTRAVAMLLERFADALWVDESGLSTSDVRQWMALAAGEYLINGSGGIGWGLAAAVGAALACPDRRVVAAIGDGSALYASEAMWTAAHHRTGILLVLFANRRYATLNEAASRLAGGVLEAFTIEPPALDFAGLATLYGWDFVRVASEDALDAFLAQAQGAPRTNVVLELVLDAAVKPVTAARHF